MPYINIEEEIWVDLDDFDTDELIEELKSRDVTFKNGNAEILQDIINAKNRNQNYDHLVNQLIYNATGQIV